MIDNIEKLRNLPLYSIQYGEKNSVVCFGLNEVEEAFGHQFSGIKMAGIAEEPYYDFLCKNIFFDEQSNFYFSEKFTLLVLMIISLSLNEDDPSCFDFKTFGMARTITCLFRFKKHEPQRIVENVGCFVDKKSKSKKENNFDDGILEGFQSRISFCRLDFALDYFDLKDDHSFKKHLVDSNLLHRKEKYICNTEYGYGEGEDIYLNISGIEKFLTLAYSFKDKKTRGVFTITK